MIGYIYKIQCPCELEYFGSTWDYESRFESHLCSMKYKDLKIYIHIRNCVVEGPLYFKFIEEVDVDCREELVFIEDKYIRFYNTVENGLNDRYAIFDENDIKKNIKQNTIPDLKTNIELLLRYITKNIKNI